MSMKCLYLKVRSKKFEKYIYCSTRKEQITYKDCINCKYKKYKQITKIKKQSKKQRKIENKRFSMITDDLNICYICGQRKDDLHELFGGCNRKKSMEWGLVIPICRLCHLEWDVNEETRKRYQQEAQQIFEKKYSHELFMSEFRKNYLEDGGNENGE